MHPNRFFDECAIRTGIDTVEIFDEELRSKLRDTHPKNFIKTRRELPVYQIKLAYFTAKGNYKNAYRYAVFNSKDDNEYSDFWLDMFVRDYNNENPDHPMKDCEILDMKYIGDAVLPIG